MQSAKPLITLSTLKIIWAALLASHFFYGFALNFLVSNTVAPTEVIPYIVPILSVLGIVIFAVAILLPRFFLARRKVQLLEEFKSVELRNIDFDELIMSFSPPYVIRLALFEGVAIIGFGLGFLFKNMEYYYPFAALSVGAYFFNFPSEENIKDSFK